MRETFWAVCALLLLGLWPVAQAAPVRDLYTVRLPVMDQGIQERQRALGEALGILMVRLTGQGTAAANPVVRSEVYRAEQFLASFGYEAAPAPVQPPVEPAPGGDGAAPAPASPAPTTTPGQQIRLDFSPAQVNALLRRASLPLWGASRPALLLWPVETAPEGDRLLTRDAQPVLFGALDRASERRGIPRLDARGDAEDSALLAATAPGQATPESLTALMQRYQAQAVLLVKLSAQGETGWQASGQLWDGQTFTPWSGTGDAEALASGALNAVAEHLAVRYAIVQGSSMAPEQVTLEVGGVDSLADYTALLRYLQGVSGVRSVMVTSVERDQVALALVADGSREQLEASLALGGRLQTEASAPVAVMPAEAPPTVAATPGTAPVAPEPAARAVLRYHWQ